MQLQLTSLEQSIVHAIAVIKWADWEIDKNWDNIWLAKKNKSNFILKHDATTGTNWIWATVSE